MIAAVFDSKMLSETAELGVRRLIVLMNICICDLRDGIRFDKLQIVFQVQLQGRFLILAKQW